LPLFSGLFQLAIALGPDRRLTAFQLVERGHVTDRTVKSDPIVLIDVGGDLVPRLFEREGRSGRTHSDLRDLCHLSIFPFDGG